MGKVHRIKKSFYKLLAQKPWETIPRHHIANYSVARCTSVYIGVRQDGSWYIGHYGMSYRALMRKLIEDTKLG